MVRSGSEPEVDAPGVVPCDVIVNYTIWEQHAERLEALRRECPHVRLGGMEGRDSPRAAPHTSRDEWGCLWRYPGMGLDGQVTEHPLDDWGKLGRWRPPSGPERAARIRREAAASPGGKGPAAAGLEHGFLFLRLTYLRGFENFMVDVGEESPKLYELRDAVAGYWYEVTKAYLDCGAARVSAGDDLGLQDRLPISPGAWRRLVKPAYARIFGLARERGAEVALHTDGYVVDIIPDLIETGVTDLNPQDLVNGLANLERLAKGKVRITLDMDRQSVTAFGAPEEVEAHVERCIRTLGSPEGGLGLVWGVYPGAPIANVEAGVRAMEKHRSMWA